MRSEWQSISIEEVPRLGEQQQLAYIFLLEHEVPAVLRARSGEIANCLLRRCAGDEGISLRKNMQGKPVLSVAGIHVSLSHSGSCLAVAVGTTGLGVDIEYLRYPDKWPALCRWIAAPGDHLETATAADFLRAWTAKEALVKVLGTGLDHGLHRVPVPALDAAAYHRVQMEERTYWLLPLPQWKDMVVCSALEGLCVVQTFFVADLPEALESFHAPVPAKPEQAGDVITGSIPTTFTSNPRQRWRPSRLGRTTEVYR